MKFNLNLKDISKINQLYEVGNDMDVPLVITKKNKPNMYMMNEKTYLKLCTKGDMIREKEIKHQAGKAKRK